MKIIVQNSKVMNGEIVIGGSKNACLPEMVAALLTKDEVTLTNVPDILDVDVMLKILAKAKINVDYNPSLKMLKLKRRRKINKINCPHISKIRASYYLMGAIFSLRKKVITSFPGGCSFVKRPIDFHLNAFKKMGAKVYDENNRIIIKRKNKIPTSISLPLESLGTTINIILASVLTKGTTIINNASTEPEVLDLIKMLKSMNADINVYEKKIIINGVKKLKGTTHRIIPDRMEAGSYLLLASSVEKSNILLKNIYSPHLESVTDLLKKQGINIIINTNEIRLIKEKKPIGTKLIADVYPNYPTDLQQIACSYFLTCSSLSIIKDNVYSKRFSEVLELLTMNAKVFIKDNILLIMPSSLIGNTVYAPDLRAGFSLIVAGCIASGKTTIENADVILRGYENIVEKLKNCQINCEII